MWQVCQVPPGMHPRRMSSLQIPLRQSVLTYWLVGLERSLAYRSPRLDHYQAVWLRYATSSLAPLSRSSVLPRPHRFRSLTSTHSVTDAGLGEDVGGVVGVVAQLAAEPLDHLADPPESARRVHAPDTLQQMVVSRRTTGIGLGPGEPILTIDRTVFELWLGCTVGLFRTVGSTLFDMWLRSL